MLMAKSELGLASRWGWIVLRGVVAVLFGLLAFAQPGRVGLGLVLMFAVYSFVSGIAALVTAARGGRANDPRWGTFLLEGLVYVAAGIVAVLWPASTAVAFLWVIAFWAIISGALEIASAIRLRKTIEHEWALGLAGALSVVFGLLMLFRPVAGGLAVVWWLGSYAVIFGALLVGLGFRLRRVARENESASHLPEDGLHQPT
ncbi:MAG TPA: HdeD family acid-resistance protein [Polyangia bacterium]